MPKVIVFDSENPQQPSSNTAQKSLPNIPGMPEIVINTSTAAPQPPPISVQPQWSWWQWPYYTFPTYVYPQPVIQVQPQPQQQQQQPQVIIIKNELPQPPPPPKEEKKKKEEPKSEPPQPPPPVVPPKVTEPEEFVPQKKSKLTYASLLFSFLGFILGIACIAETYKANDARREAEELETVDSEYLSLDDSFNTTALRLGSFSSLFFFIAILCSSIAGHRHVRKVKDVVDETCCIKTTMILGWITFAIGTITSLIVLMMAIDEDYAIRPPGVWLGFCMYFASWMLMYGYSEMARKL